MMSKILTTVKGILQVKYKFPSKVDQMCIDYDKIKSCFVILFIFLPGVRQDIILTNPEDLILTLQWSSSLQSRDLFT
jgi:hypothetical protein